MPGFPQTLIQVKAMRVAASSLCVIVAVGLSGSTGCAQSADSSARRIPDRICSVTRIVDGDTFVCGAAGRVRFIGIDAPELNQAPYGAQSSSALASLMPIGSEVRLQADVSPTDRYRRVLAYVWVDTLLVNEAMVARGWSVAVSFPPDTGMQDRLRRAQQRARDAKAGLWATGGFSCLPGDRRRRYC